MNFRTYTDEQVEAAADEMASMFFHGGYLMRRELGDPVCETSITPSVWRERRRAASRVSPPSLTADQRRLALYGLGISDEAGEVSGHIKKHLFHGKPLDREYLLLECGDVLWYIDFLLTLLGYTMEDALQANDDKLTERYPAGFDAAVTHDGNEGAPLEVDGDG